ncbi:MAG: hypothetical protein Q4G43_06415 [Mobilicoccus sp.]|nr:hypothetical protein [Mobilicoccus sp.]
MLAFVHQHRAKSFFEQGDLDTALLDARRALALRERAADEKTLTSTRQTLARIESVRRTRSDTPTGGQVPPLVEEER